MWIHDISNRVSETKSCARWRVRFHCIITWDGNVMTSIYSGVRQIYIPHHSAHLRYWCMSLHPPPPPNHVGGGPDVICVQTKLETGIEWTQRSILRPGQGQFREEFGNFNRVYLEMHLEDMLEGVCWFTWASWLNELRNSLGDRKCVSLDIHFEIKIERTQRYTVRQWSS